MSVCNGLPPYTGSTPLPYMVCGDPDSGTDHSLKEVNAYIIWYRVHTWGLQGKCHIILCALLCIFTNNIHISVKNVCSINKKGPFLALRLPKELVQLSHLISVTVI